MLNFRAALLLAAIMTLAGSPLRADLLLGSQLTGTLQLAKTPVIPNWYDPTMCQCGPLGSSNAANATVSLNSGDNTFAANIPTLNLITADWSVTTQGDFLTFNVTVDSGTSGLAWTQTFQDAALANFTLAPVTTTNPFPGGLSFSSPNATTWVFNWNGSGVSNGGLTNYSATFSLTDPPGPASPTSPTSPLPEGSSTLPMALELGGLGLFVVYGRRMKSSLPSNH